MKKFTAMLFSFGSYWPWVYQAAIFTLAFLWPLESVHPAEFFCSSGDVTCLIASINDANGMSGDHTINLEPGIYTLYAVDNTIDGPNGLPSIRLLFGSKRLQEILPR
jgi:hypothetical protein